jgi:hypothetical protein
MQNEQVLEFISSKLKDAESRLKTREAMEMVWRGGTNATWAAAAALHPSTAGKSLSKRERLKQADTHARIAVKLKHEVEMFKAALELVSKAIQTKLPIVETCQGCGGHGYVMGPSGSHDCDCVRERLRSGNI